MSSTETPRQITIYNLPHEQNACALVKLLAEYLCALDHQSPGESPTTWLFPVRAEPLDLDPETEADALVGNVFQFLGDRYGVEGRTGRALTFEKQPVKSVATYSSSTEKLNTKLGCVYHEKSVYAFILGSSHPPDDANIRPWMEAVSYAEAAKSAGHPFHEWTAVIGLIEAGFRRVTDFSSDGLTLGDLHFSPCDFAYEEYRSPSTPSLISSSIFRWIPIVVSGRSQGHDWRSAEFAALKTLYRACGLLSLESGSPWVLKESPRPAEWGQYQFPEATPLITKKELPVQVSGSQPEAPLKFDGDRLARRWARWIETDALSAPIDAYYEAALLRERHPSFALVGFVAAIEEVGKLLIQPAATEKCPTCNKDRTSSSAERFRAALRLVLPEEKIKDVSNALYRWRSGTAHAGRTYSSESSYGRNRMDSSLLAGFAESTFFVKGSTQADQLAQKLISLLLDGRATATNQSE